MAHENLNRRVLKMLSLLFLFSSCSQEERNYNSEIAYGNLSFRFYKPSGFNLQGTDTLKRNDIVVLRKQYDNMHDTNLKIEVMLTLNRTTSFKKYPPIDSLLYFDSATTGISYYSYAQIVKTKTMEYYKYHYALPEIQYVRDRLCGYIHDTTAFFITVSKEHLSGVDSTKYFQICDSLFNSIQVKRVR